MPRITAEHRLARRRQITDAALVLIGSKGLHRTTMADIVQQSGLSAGAIYTHFASKEEILAEMGTRALTGVAEHLEELTRTTPVPAPWDVLRQLDSALGPGVTAAHIVQVWGIAVVEPWLKAAVSGPLGRLQTALVDYGNRWQQHNARSPLDGPEIGQLMLTIGQAALLQHAIGHPFLPDDLPQLTERLLAPR